MRPPGSSVVNTILVLPTVTVTSRPSRSAAAFSCQTKGRSWASAKFLFKRPDNHWCTFVFVIGCVAGQTDTPVLVAVPAVVENMTLGADVGLNGLVDIVIELFAFVPGPVFVA